MVYEFNSKYLPDGERTDSHCVQDHPLHLHLLHCAEDELVSEPVVIEKYNYCVSRDVVRFVHSLSLAFSPFTLTAFPFSRARAGRTIR